MKNNKIKKLVSFFFEVGNLRKIPRSHQQALLTQDLSDNIATHSFRVAIIGYFLAQYLEADSDKVIKMCLFHDLEETRTGDQNWIHKSYIKSFEGEVRKDQIKNLENVEEFKKISEEYDDRESLESKIAKDADYLDELFLLKEFAWQGNKEAELWLKRGAKEENKHKKRLYTKLAKKIAQEVRKHRPSTWWDDAWSADRRK